MISRLKPSLQRKQRTRNRIKRFSDRIRLTVFRSSKHIYAQLIDPEKGKVLASVADTEIKETMPKTKLAFETGKLLGEKAAKVGVKEAVLDRGGYKYHGRVKAICEGAREAKLSI